MNISQITKKFYKSEEERIKKLQENLEHVKELQGAIENDIETLYKNKIRFMIVNINPKELSVNALMVPCCGSKEPISEADRECIVNKIITRTKFKEVIWEL
jgi:hypothetical protein